MATIGAMGPMPGPALDAACPGTYISGGAFPGVSTHMNSPEYFATGGGGLVIGTGSGVDIAGGVSSGLLWMIVPPGSLPYTTSEAITNSVLPYCVQLFQLPRTSSETRFRALHEVLGCQPVDDGFVWHCVELIRWCCC